MHTGARSVVAFAVALGALTLSSAVAQEFRATVTGRITDQSRGAMPGVTVVVTNTETNETATAVASADGAYSIPFLQPGVYTLTAELDGFKTYTQEDLRLQVGQTATVNIAMQVGDLTETVTVTGDTLEASRADRGMVIDSRRVTEIPLNTRNPFMLSLLSSGITFNGPAIYQRPFDNGAIADWSINGGANRNNEFLLDGAPNNSVQGGNNIAYVPPADSVGEFKIVQNSYDAQYGRSAGGTINVSLKSGTNDFHGTGYEFARRKALDANTEINKRRGEPTPGHTLDQYGFQIDGPIVRDKTFFMVALEDYNEETPNIEIESFPDGALRRGDFSDLVTASGQPITIYDPATGRVDANGTFVRDPFPNNIIPENRISPIARALMDSWPMPNSAPAEGCQPWRCNFLLAPNIARDDFYNFVTKVDHVVSTNTRMFVRYAQNDRTSIRSTNGIPGPPEDGFRPHIRENYTGVWDLVHTVNSSLVLNVRSSLNRYVEANRTDAGLGFDATTLGFPTDLVNQLPQQIFPRIEITNEFTNLGRGTFDEGTTTVFGFQPNFSWLKGRHTFRGGLDMRMTWLARENSGQAGMLVQFNDTFTRQQWDQADPLSGSSFASFLLGYPTSGRVDNNVFPTFRWNYFAPWFQDDWKVTDRLTLNFGLRWDFNSPVWEEDNRLNFAFDPTVANPANDRINHEVFPRDILGGLQFIGEPDAPAKYPYEFDTNNIQPRIGFAYMLNDQTILKGGYGLYYMNPTATSFSTGFSIETPIVASADGGRSPTVTLENPFPDGIAEPPGSALGLETFLGHGLSFSNPEFEIPKVHQFHLGVQRFLGWNTSVELAYVGSRTRGLQTSWDAFNEPPVELRDACNPALGGDPAFCRERLPNPFQGVAGFEGTERFESATLDRWSLSRPFPQFDAITESERNDGRINYNSFQAVVDKRFSQGLALNATYTWSRMTERSGWLDASRLIPQEGLAATDRPHRLTFSAVYDLPIGNGRHFLTEARGPLNAIVGGWEVAAIAIFNSGQPWDLPNVYLDPDGTTDRINAAAINTAGRDDGDVIRAINAPCTARWDDSGVIVPRGPFDQAGCTEAWFITPPSFSSNRVVPLRSDDIRRTPYRQLDVNFAKMTQLTRDIRVQFRVEIFNILNIANYEMVQFNSDLDSPEFGTIHKNDVDQSNAPRQIQLAVKVIW